MKWFRYSKTAALAVSCEEKNMSNNHMSCQLLEELEFMFILFNEWSYEV